MEPTSSHPVLSKAACGTTIRRPVSLALKSCFVFWYMGSDDYIKVSTLQETNILKQNVEVGFILDSEVCAKANRSIEQSPFMNEST